jgi:hypothetical protein
MSKTDPIIFWICWAGTVIIPITGHLVSDRWMGFFFLECILFPVGLCFASAVCVRTFPRLAKLGMYSLVITILLSIVIAIILAHLNAQ